MLYLSEDSIRTPDELAARGFAVYTAQLGLDTPSALRHAINNQLLPVKMNQRLDKIVRLIDELDGVSQSEASRILGVSRFTVSGWRRRLGLGVVAASEEDPLDDEPSDDGLVEPKGAESHG